MAGTCAKLLPMKTSFRTFYALLLAALFSITGASPTHAQTIREQYGITSYLHYGGGPGHLNISSTDQFKVHRFFVDNFRHQEGDLLFRTQPTEQNYKNDQYLQLLKDAGIAAIWCTQGSFDFNVAKGKQGKIMPIDDADDRMDPRNWADLGAFCAQVAIRYADDTEQHLGRAKVFQSSTWQSNTPKAGLGLLQAIEIQNEWNFLASWSGGFRTFTPEEYAVALKVARDSIRQYSQTIRIIMGGGIGGDIEDITRTFAQLDLLYAAEGKQTPNDIYPCFHWYMRFGSTNQSGGQYGISPEEAGAVNLRDLMDSVCAARNLPGWYCTETGWSTDNSKQSAPIQQGYTREESQGILMNRLALIWGASPYFQATSFWHCRDDYDSPPYAKGGINYKDWSPKPARTIAEAFLDTYGSYDVTDYWTEGSNEHYALLERGSEDLVLGWSDGVNNGDLTPVPRVVYVSPPTPEPTPTCSDGIQNQGETGVDCGGPCASCDPVPPVDPPTPVGSISVTALELPGYGTIVLPRPIRLLLEN